MKLILSLLSACLFFMPVLHAQDSLFKKNAIFLSFEDFKNNKPSIDTLKLHLAERSNYKNKLMYETGNGDSMAVYKGDLWGFSDSTDAYIKHNGYYGLIIATGRYCVFSYMKNLTTYGGPMAGGGMTASRSAETKLYYVLDYMTGEIEELKVRKVKECLADDPGLSKEYKDESNRDGMMVQYIRRYNENHPLKRNEN